MASYDREKIGTRVARGRDARGVVYLTEKGQWTTVAHFCTAAVANAYVNMFKKAGHSSVESVAYLDALAATFGGCVRLWSPRGADVVVGVYKGDEAGMDTDNGNAPWSLVCEDHSTILCFKTRALAENHGVDPRGWCEVCNKTMDANHEYIGSRS